MTQIAQVTPEIEMTEQVAVEDTELSLSELDLVGGGTALVLFG